MLNKIWNIFHQDGIYAIPRRILAKLLRELNARYEEVLFRRKSCYSLDSNIYTAQLMPRAKARALEGLSLKDCIPKAVSQHYLNHHFDLLGSGWVQVRYGMRCQGMAGYHYETTYEVVPDSVGYWLVGRLNQANLATAQKIWQQVDTHYTPIDWQLDFKSGYRWSEKIYASRLPVSHLPGADIKVPWELSRMQHLPQLALRASSLGEDNNEAYLLVREIRNQWLDFIATNPPGFGVNWLCPMDIAIRGANWCLAWDILQASGFSLEPEDQSILAHSLYDHGCYIMKHLEWSRGHRANHYLADIAGLTFIASYLKSSTKTDAWLAFSIQELVTEMDHQFYPDGCNFEGSTAYHRFSSEMIFFSTALLLGLPSERKSNLKHQKYGEINTGIKNLSLQKTPPQFYSLQKNDLSAQQEVLFPAWYFERMERMAEFVMHITKPNNHIPQIGDNDNGRFFKLHPKYHKMSVLSAKQKYINLIGYDSLSDEMDYYIEDHLDCSHLVNIAYALFNRNDFSEWLNKKPPRKIKNQDYLVIKLLSNSIAINAQRLPRVSKIKQPNCSIGSEREFNKIHLEIEKKYNDCVLLYKSKNKPNKSGDQISLYSYPDFGLYLFVSDNIYLAIRCWPGRKPYMMSHMHLDQYSVELVIDGNEIISDPGSYIYTPLPIERWKYRSDEAHFSPFLSHNIEQWKKLDPFSSITLQPAYPAYFGLQGFFSSIDRGLEYGSFCFINVKDNEIKLYGFDSDNNQVEKRYTEQRISDGYGSVLKNLSIVRADED